MTKKDDIEPMSRKEWKAMKHDSTHFVPSKPYDDYDFLKNISMKKTKKEVRDDAKEI